MATKYITISHTPGASGEVYYPLSLRSAPIPPLQGHSLLIRISAAALNHCDHFLRQHLYPGTAFGAPILADGAGLVVAIGPDASPDWLNQRVLINPAAGWVSSPYGPEEKGGYVRIMGGTEYNPQGTLTQYMVVSQDEVEPVPPHLSDIEAAALPVAGLTAWRALMAKAGGRNCGPGNQVLITGIGGGVALMALLFAVNRGARVWVTSSSREKLEAAIRLRAQGGVDYRDEGWVDKILNLLPGETFLIMRVGGVVVIYGMTTGPVMPFPMRAVLRNLDIHGSALGSRREFAEMVKFVTEQRIWPVISRVVHGIENLNGIEELFDMLRSGRQFGKLVISLNSDKQSRL